MTRVELWLHALDKCFWLIAICVGIPVAFPKSYLTFRVTSSAWSPSTAYTFASFRKNSHLFSFPWRSISSLLHTPTKQESWANSKCVMGLEKDNMPRAGQEFGFLSLIHTMVVLDHLNWGGGYQIEKGWGIPGISTEATKRQRLEIF